MGQQMVGAEKLCPPYPLQEAEGGEKNAFRGDEKDRDAMNRDASPATTHRKRASFPPLFS